MHSKKFMDDLAPGLLHNSSFGVFFIDCISQLMECRYSKYVVCCREIICTAIADCIGHICCVRLMVYKRHEVTTRMFMYTVRNDMWSRMSKVDTPSTLIFSICLGVPLFNFVHFFLFLIAV